MADNLVVRDTGKADKDLYGTGTASRTGRQRVHYLDSARALASILGIFFHAGRVFCHPWAINVDPNQFSQLILVASQILSYCRMPLFLFAAGFFTMYGLQKRGAFGFLRQRARRIVLPFVVSVVTLIPIQAYFSLRFNFGENWLTHLGARLNPLSPEFNLYHLWFLYYIVIFSILFVGYKQLSKRWLAPAAVAKKGVSLVHRNIVTAVLFWGTVNAVFTFGGITVASWLMLNETWIPLYGFGHELPMFVFGCYCYHNRKDLERILDLSLAKLSCLMVVFGGLYYVRLYLATLDFSHSWSILELFDILLRWILTLGVLSLLRRVLNRRTGFLSYLSGASYPVYLFHQPIIIAVSYFYVGSSLSLSTYNGYALVCAASLVLTYLSYEIFVRRSGIGSFLFTGSASK
jgi:glucan biosynthesis protein C